MTDNNNSLKAVGLEYDQNQGYAHMVHCLNCNWFKTCYIPFGIQIKHYLENKKCERCKCQGVLY